MDISSDYEKLSKLSNEGILYMQRKNNCIAFTILFFLGSSVTAQSSQSSGSAKALFYEQLAESPSQVSNIGMSYWIELRRNGATKRVDSRYKFHSGDKIKFHITPDINGHAHVVMLEGSSGAKSILFPVPGIDPNNVVRRGKDHVIPKTSYLVFNNKRGREHLRIGLSRNQVKTAEFLKPQGTSEIAMASITSNAAVDPSSGSPQLLVAFPEDDQTPKAPAIESTATDEGITNAIPNTDQFSKDLFRDDPVPVQPHIKKPASSAPHRVAHRARRPPMGTAAPLPVTVVLNTNAKEDLYVDISLEHD